jgi:predicted CoA-substrate-specific enzyme activase
MFVGLDIGSVTSKALVLDDTDEVLSFSLIPTSYDREQCGRAVFDRALREAGKREDAVRGIVSTGYGRRSVTFSHKAVTEILCHAEGTKRLFPSVRTVVDIGGQDSKVIELDEEGTIRRFEMNDKCAAGTGRFLEVLSERILNVRVEEIGPLSLESRDPCTLSSVCTVFAESEIVSYLSEKRERSDVACGLNRAIAKRVLAMGRAAQIGFPPPVCFTGGVAKNVGVVRAIEEQLKGRVIVPDRPQMTAALGAALFAKRLG